MIVRFLEYDRGTVTVHPVTWSQGPHTQTLSYYYFIFLTLCTSLPNILVISKEIYSSILVLFFT